MDSPDPELEARLHEHLSKSYQQSFKVEVTDGGEQGAPQLIAASDARIEDEEIYEFRLFDKPSRPEVSREPKHSLQKIALRSPTPPSGEPGFINPQRPDGYYFAGAPSPELLEQYRATAISGAEILEGMEMKWVWLSFSLMIECL